MESDENTRSDVPRTETADVVVIGGGPSGASAATRLAQAGLDVVVIEKKRYPRAKTCGDGLTPRSVKALLDLGMADELSRWHTVRGLRAYGGGRMLELEWPEHPVFPPYGAVVTRAELDMAIADRAKAAGARFFEQTEATDPVLRDGVIRGVLCKPKQGDPFRIDTGWVVVADGSLSRFGRGLGNERDRRFPLGMAIRGYFDSPRDKDGFIESHLDIRDAEGRALPGYGWVFPEADGTVNVGIGLLSTFKDWKGVNTSYLMEAFAQQTAESWQFDPDAGRDVRGGKLPMGLSVRPRVGPNWITVGDAGGSINPFNGEGIAYAMETAELGTDVLIGAVRTGNGAHLLRYPQILDEKYADYYRAARAFVRLIGEPRIMKVLANVGMRSEPLMRFVLQVMANLLSPELRGAQDRTYRMLEKVVLVGPEP